MFNTSIYQLIGKYIFLKICILILAPMTQQLNKIKPNVKGGSDTATGCVR